MKKQSGEITVLAAVAIGVLAPFIINLISGSVATPRCNYTVTDINGTLVSYANNCGLTKEEAFKGTGVKFDETTIARIEVIR